MHYLHDILILLAASIFIVVLMQKLRLSPVLGYLVVGALIGEHGLLLVQNNQYTRSLAEFGVVFLLFVIGLELTFERLIRMRLHVFGFGSAQVLLTSSILHLCLTSFYHFNTAVSFFVAVSLALSSTAVVLQVLAENGLQSTQVGRLSLSVLLMQDLIVVPLLAILPLLAGAHENIFYAICASSLKAIFSVVAITVFGRIFLRPFFSLIGSAKSDEVYVTTALLIVLGASTLTNNLGLSTAMGAFLAGLLIAETEYRNKIEDSIKPFQGLFLALFFLSVGMSVDIEFITANFKAILLYSSILLSLKAVVILLLCKLFRFNWGASLHSSFLLSQGSEFAFIVFSLAASKGIIDGHSAQMLLMIVAFSMAITPLLSVIGRKIEERVDSKNEIDRSGEFKGVSDLSNHVIIAGFGRVGRLVAYMLSEEKIDYIALDTNAALVKKARTQGFPIYHGDMTNHDTLTAIGANRAACIVLSMSNKLATLRSVKLARENFRKLQIIARVEDSKQARQIKKSSADVVTVPTTIETGLQLGGAVLRNRNIPEHEIITIKDRVRRHDYNLTEVIELFKGIPLGNNHNALKEETE